MCLCRDEENLFKLSLEPLFKDILVFVRKEKLLPVFLFLLLRILAYQSLFHYSILKYDICNRNSWNIYVKNWWNSFFESDSVSLSTP